MLTDQDIDEAWRSQNYTADYDTFRMAVGRAIESAATAPLLERIAELTKDVDHKDAFAEQMGRELSNATRQIAELEAKLAQQAPEAPKQTSNWLHLKKYGYAPGGYMCKCAQCGQTAYDLEKRATTCRPCAEALHAKANAQQAEAQEPVEHQYQSSDGTWHGFIDERHKKNTIEDGRWPIRALFTRPQPAQLQRLSEEEVHDWWARTNGMEDHDMCNLQDFRDAVRRVESALAAKNGAALK